LHLIVLPSPIASALAGDEEEGGGWQQREGWKLNPGPPPACLQERPLSNGKLNKFILEDNQQQIIKLITKILTQTKFLFI